MYLYNFEGNIKFMRSNTLNGKSNIVGKNIQKYRLSKNLSLRKLSEKLELQGIVLYHTDIFEIENQSRLVKDFELKAICKTLNISYDDIFRDTDYDDI